VHVDWRFSCARLNDRLIELNVAKIGSCWLLRSFIQFLDVSIKKPMRVSAVIERRGAEGQKEGWRAEREGGAGAANEILVRVQCKGAYTARASVRLYQ
jgi:hypothetical protein